MNPIPDLFPLLTILLCLVILWLMGLGAPKKR